MKILKLLIVAGVVLTFTKANNNAANGSLLLNFDASSISSNTPHTGAAATVKMDFADDGGDVRITLTLDNTTGELIFGDGATDSKFTGFGIDLPSPGVYLAGGFVSGAYFDNVLLGEDANPFGTLDVSVADNKKLLGGNANSALAPGDGTDVASFLVSGLGNAASTETAFETALLNAGSDPLFEAFARFQQVEGGNNNGASDKLIYQPESSVPEPGAIAVWSLMMLGGLGLVYRRRTRQQ